MAYTVCFISTSSKFSKFPEIHNAKIFPSAIFDDIYILYNCRKKTVNISLATPKWFEESI